MAGYRTDLYDFVIGCGLFKLRLKGLGLLIQMFWPSLSAAVLWLPADHLISLSTHSLYNKHSAFTTVFIYAVQQQFAQ